MRWLGYSLLDISSCFPRIIRNFCGRGCLIYFSMKNRSMMKWRLRRDSRCSSVDYEDIRRSLEVLDSVLAEYDDTWNAPHPFMNGIDPTPTTTSDSQRLLGENETGYNSALRDSPTQYTFSSCSSSLDGSTSQSSHACNSEQAKISSPPPVPKRSPATHLSDSTHFSFPSDATSTGSEDSILSALSSQPLHLSITTAAGKIRNREDNDEVFLSAGRHCLACGSQLDMAGRWGGEEDSPSAEGRRRGHASPASVRRTGSTSYIQRVSKNGVSLTENETNELLSSPRLRLTSFRTPPTNRKYDLSPKTRQRSPRCCCQRKIQQLDAKFAETRELLRTKVIRALETDPPSFKPIPPLVEDNPSLEPMCNGDSSEGSDSWSSRGGAWRSKQDLCDKCSRLLVTETIEDLPKLIPTDALNRPQLGLSYSMEDDLSPGVKEIRTSTPKSNVSLRFSPKLSSNEQSSCLSTFSQSANSLGYISSQSDLELNLSVPSGDKDKVPVASLKSQTLPIGIKLTPSPFYSTSDRSCENGYHSHTNELKSASHSPTNGDLELRSSSAPPLPPKVEKKKKHMRGFSRKEKKKNEDNLSVKSDLSLDEGIILKRIDALDGSTDLPDYIEKIEGSDDKPKKRSVWKSILRRK